MSTKSQPTARPSAGGTLVDLLHRALPAAPVQMLLLGEFSAEERVGLQARGEQLTLLSWQDTVDPALAPAGAHGELRQVRLTAPACEGIQFDAVLARGLGPDIHPLALFEALDGVLAPHGALVLTMAAMAASVDGWLAYVADLAARCGFALDQTSDDSDAGAAQEQGSGPGRDLSPVQVFRRAATAPRWRVGHVQSKDFDEVATLFQDVFGHPLSRALWDWKYGSGRGNAVMARRGGKVVAHYGGMYRDIVVGGQPERVAQICDVMVQSTERGVLTRQGPFFLMGTSWPEIYGPLGFGFPTMRAMHVAQKMGLYTQVGQMAEVRWTPAAPGARLGTRVRSLQRGRAADQALVQPLWEAMAQDLRQGVVGVKDWAFLERRYFSHPHNHYEVMLVTARLSGKPLGVMVMRRLDGACELLDVIAPFANFARVIDQARRMTRRWSLPYLYGWITTVHAPLFVACGAKEQVLDLSIPASSWTRNPRSELFQDKWWLMAGDTDFR